MSGPARIILRLDPGRDLRKLVRIDQLDRIAPPVGRDDGFGSEPRVVELPSGELQPVLVARQRFDRLALGSEPGRVGEPPEPQAKPRFLECVS